MLAAQGFTASCDELAHRAPQVHIHHGWHARLAARLPGYSAGRVASPRLDEDIDALLARLEELERRLQQ